MIIKAEVGLAGSQVCTLLFLLDLFVQSIATLQPLKQSAPKAADKRPGSI
jgi:hypothetical protein